MNIMVLEDDPERITVFDDELYGFSVDFVENVSDALDLLSNFHYDLVFLDHDLDGGSMVPSHYKNTGYQVAKFMADEEINEEAVIFIHSMNPIGAQNIKRVLPDAMIRPFMFMDIRKTAESVYTTLIGYRPH